MKESFIVSIDSWKNGEQIPSKYAFGQIPKTGHFELGGNISPSISWENAPKETKSFAIICHDPDVPSIGDDVNQEGKVIPSDLPRVDFYHWVLADIPVHITSLTEGEASSGVTAKGKSPGKKEYGLAGLNNYTQWFEGDLDMGGYYADYDGPCPPWNDSIVHHYHFTVYALDEVSLELNEIFDANDLIKAMEGHILAENSWVGTYSMNPKVQS
ncbi:YbhB/YbcL family Raf kinase inhibitor-like protein [Poseidonibacter lekithochrous]|uniref:YbhB/YbcL family Raf kinase inhibitor-like protein n=1 Tax=Poseidonibacter TaxID=2321187 RepID=UPI001C097F9C|nr:MULTISPECIES: YbhB/YbcL family Raf kinase inhibitor-like protein [Poseidonibacter]MBU3013178.1 YbhB/YbcL family Raf kinase inhibitor-like protein [Poseidonibacter lekithochrous]MDO6826474.1 YbhB/YbcL family Raf kinase inhibitor-like protein [Poseidonibacter sp. 1_MG-2023]